MLSVSLLKLIELRFADPVCALSLSDEFVCLGTMMGRVAALCLKDDHYKRPPFLLRELSSENITGISFVNPSNFYLSIGDDEVLKYNITFTESQPSINAESTKNYADDSKHKAGCDSCYTMLTRDYLLMLFLNNTSESTEQISETITFLYLKSLANNSIVEKK